MDQQVAPVISGLISAFALLQGTYTLSTDSTTVCFPTCDNCPWELRPQEDTEDISV